MFDIHMLGNKERKIQSTDKSPKIGIETVAEGFLFLDAMTHNRLQKLSYYAYSWYYTLFGRKLFNNNFQAWVQGPVCPQLYQIYKEYGWRKIDQIQQLPEILTVNSYIMEYIALIYNSYKHLNDNQLECLTHKEDPWKEARGNLGDLTPCITLIRDDTILRFYRKVYESFQKV